MRGKEWSEMKKQFHHLVLIKIQNCSVGSDFLELSRMLRALEPPHLKHKYNFRSIGPQPIKEKKISVILRMINSSGEKFKNNKHGIVVCCCLRKWYF